MSEEQGEDFLDEFGINRADTDLRLTPENQVHLRALCVRGSTDDWLVRLSQEMSDHNRCLWALIEQDRKLEETGPLGPAPTFGD